MRYTIPALAVLTLALTGCGPAAIDDVEPDTPRAEKDEIYTTYIRDTYGEEYPSVTENTEELVPTVLWICSALDDGQNTSTLDTDMGLDRYPEKDQPALHDILYQGTRVYCPQHTGSLEWMNTRVAG